MKPVYQQTTQELYEQFGSAEKGLTTEEAGVLLTRHGPNQLAEGKRESLLLVFLKHQQIFLKSSQLPARIDKVQAGQHFLDETVVFAEAVAVADIPAVADDAGEGQFPAVEGGKLGGKIPLPGIGSLILTDDASCPELV